VDKFPTKIFIEGENKMMNEIQEIVSAAKKVKRVKISSELLKRLLPNFYEGILIFIDDLYIRYNNQSILSIKKYFNCILETQKDLDDDVLIVRIPMLERALNDNEVYLTEYIDMMSFEEKEVLKKLGLTQ
jgi:hypothetical protein